MGARRADGRRTPHRRWIVGAVVSLVVGIVVPAAAAAPPAQAALHNPIPFNEVTGEPTYDFVDDDALSVYVTSDIRGGTACIVDRVGRGPIRGVVRHARRGSSPNDIVGIGSVITLLEAPTLFPGNWRILVTDSTGVPTAISEVFTVTACQTCSRGPALEVVEAWKARARRHADRPRPDLHGVRHQGRRRLGHGGSRHGP